MSMPIPPRTTSLDPDAAAWPTLDVGRPWWQPLRPWPPGMRFDDVDPALLDVERIVDSVRLGPPEVPITSSAGMCVDVAPMLEPGADISLRKWIRRRFHPFDRAALKVPA
jgi:hypothetical protein